MQAMRGYLGVGGEEMLKKNSSLYASYEGKNSSLYASYEGKNSSLYASYQAMRGYLGGRRC